MFSLFDEFLFCKFIILSLEPSVGQTTNLTVQKKAAGNSWCIFFFPRFKRPQELVIIVNPSRSDPFLVRNSLL